MNQKALLDWYLQNHRDLPFRKNRDPYRIWISEIMAQQTRIEAMLGAYENFMTRFPTLQALALADEEEVLKAWQGLGYYSRARSLHKCAKLCLEQYQGKLPETYEELLKLPGIGEYTAGAIASIAHGQRVCAIDGNVIRVYSRLCRLEDDFSKAAAKKKLRAIAQADLPESEWMPLWTQALMELGALVCVPTSPRCSICPLASQCEARASKTQDLYPKKVQKKEKKPEEITVIVQAAQNERGQWQVRVVKRPKGGLLAGLYGFDNKLPSVILQQYALEEHVHIFTHKIWHMQGTLVVTRWDPSFSSLEWIEQNAAIPSAFAPFWNQAKAALKTLAARDGKSQIEIPQCAGNLGRKESESA